MKSMKRKWILACAAWVVALGNVEGQIIVIQPVVPSASPTFAPTSQISQTLTPTPAPTETDKPTLLPTEQPTSTPPTREPTVSPTIKPTVAPSIKPTVSPTLFPTQKPSSSPTKSPSRSPTHRPTFSPSNSPTSSPTQRPTASPSNSPTSNPTQRPTASPSKSPTSNPTQRPTGSPSNSPTSNPTQRPSLNPTGSPSKMPTGTPSLQPTSTPSRSPSEAPTNTPSKSPSKSPSRAPSKSPTQNPTKRVTSSPTVRPTAGPTKYPSPSPSKRPTTSPTQFPTRFPTRVPTRFPTRFPTKFPTKSPTTTSEPTQSPSVRPTRSPTKRPSRSPTNLPTQPRTDAPSKAPSVSPSTQPSNAPTRLPTLQPTNPTFQPTTALSEVPSTSPTLAPTAILTSPSGKPAIAGQTGDFCESEFVFYPEMDGFLMTSFVFAGLGVLISLIGLFFIFWYRAKPILVLSQRVFLTLFCVGILIVNASLVPSILGVINPSPSYCDSSTFLLYFGLSFSISCLFVKEWRVWRVHTRTMKEKNVKIDNKVLFLYIALVNAFMVALLAVWIGAFPETPDPCEGFVCSSSNSVVSYVVFTLLVVLVLVTVVQAFLSREIPSVGGESIGILVTVSFSLFAIVLVGILIVSGAVSLQLETWLLSFAVFCCSVVALGSIVFRKWLYVSYPAQHIQAMFLRSNMSTMGGPPHPSQRFHRQYSQHSEPYTNTRTDKEGYFHSEPAQFESRSQGGAAPVPIYSRYSDRASLPERTRPSYLGPNSTGSQSANSTQDVRFDGRFSPEDDGFERHFVSAVPLGRHPQARSMIEQPTFNAIVEEELSVNNEPPHTKKTTSAPVKAPEPPSEQLLNEIRSRGFKIGEENGWEEFVDRESGGSFWLNPATGQVSHTCPRDMNEVNLV